MITKVLQIIIIIIDLVRSRARDILKVQLDDFRAQRAAGLGGMFGPPDVELRGAEETQEKRLAVINDRLVINII